MLDMCLSYKQQKQITNGFSQHLIFLLCPGKVLLQLLPSTTLTVTTWYTVGGNLLCGSCLTCGIIPK